MNEYMNEEIIIKQCICCWYDLLGYGQPFIDSNWNLKDPRCKVNIQRIENVRDWFWGILSTCHKATKLYFNDGSISNIDVDTNCDKSLYSALFFLEAIIRDYIAVNDVDRRMGFPGVRGVLTCGHRFDYEYTNTSFDLAENRTVAYYPREFQMNTAFSKAFIMEESGSKAGIKGANLYIDKELFKFFQRTFEYKENHNIQVQEMDDNLKVIITFDNEWFATVILDKELVIYENRGINTELCRLVSIDSKLDDMAKEAARQQALRFALMEEISEE